MFKAIVAAAFGVFLASGAFAQSQQYNEASQLLKRAGVTFEIPTDATQEQLNEIIAIGSTLQLQDAEAKFDFETKVKKILGMQ